MSVFTFCFLSFNFFLWRYFKGNYWSVCVNMVKNISNCFFLQRTIALYQNKLFILITGPIPIFCNRVLWGSYVQTLDTTCVTKSGTPFFSRHAQPPLGLWLRALQCGWINILLRIPSIWFLLDRNAMRFSFCCKGIQKTKRSVIVLFYLLLVASLRFSLVYLFIQFVFSATALHFR